MRRVRMTRAAAIGLLAISLITSSTPVAAAKTTKSTIQVTFESAELIENNHVGNEWSEWAKVNGKAITEGQTLSLQLASTDSVKLSASATEDDKYPETGNASQSVKVSSISKTSKHVKLTVTVTENRGRYSGNTATWSFDFSVKKKA